MVTYLVFLVLVKCEEINHSLFQDLFPSSAKNSKKDFSEYLPNLFIGNEFKRKLHKLSKLQKKEGWTNNFIELLVGVMGFKTFFSIKNNQKEKHFIFPLYNIPIKLFSDNLRINIANINLQSVKPSFSASFMETIVFGSGLSYLNLILPSKLIAKIVEINPYMCLIMKKQDLFENVFLEDGIYKLGFYFNLMHNVFCSLSNGIIDLADTSSIGVTQFNFGGNYKKFNFLLNLNISRDDNFLSSIAFFGSLFNEILTTVYQGDAQTKIINKKKSTTIKHEKIWFCMLSTIQILKTLEVISQNFSIVNILPFVSLNDKQWFFGLILQIDVSFFRILISIDQKGDFTVILGCSFVQDFSGELTQKFSKTEHILEL